ncbi:3567_t:CDS:1 [Acaulospora colombiana]|uniref:3567_t:CDS:1 n=1 Tax=Acaulospora colombiana TaxID=27376 RepID=A0ACA9MZ41_9GLOM|nr:3567_t:CDS:1 [Acaulospora colombiana]
MSFGSVSGGVSRNQTIMRYLSVDPETYPLLGMLAVIFGAAGYMMGRKFSSPNDKNMDNLLKTPRAYPWQRVTNTTSPVVRNESKGEEYKYRYQRFLDHNDGTLSSPSVISEYKIRGRFSKEVLDKLPKNMVKD